MDASDRIGVEFDRLLTLDDDERRKRSSAEQVVFCLVATRCEIDINSFDSAYEQLLGPAELDILITRLRHMNENELADLFQRGFELLKADGFYDHMNWSRVSEGVKEQIAAIGTNLGDRLWDLDMKLVQLLDEATE